MMRSSSISVHPLNFSRSASLDITPSGTQRFGQSLQAYIMIDNKMLFYLWSCWNTLALYLIWSIFQLIYVTTYLACFRPIFVYFLSSCRTLLYTFAIEDLIVILFIDSSYSIGGKGLHQALLLLDATPSFILKIK